MGKEHDKVADVEDKKKKGADVDVDKEHNKDVSKKTSNAALRGEAGAKAGSASNASGETALTYLAAEFYNLNNEIKDTMASDTSGDAGAEPQVQALEAIYHRALRDTIMAHNAILSMDKGSRQFHRAKLAAVLGNFNGFKPFIHRAGSWIRQQVGHEQDTLVDYQPIERELEALQLDMNVAPFKSEEVHTTKPEGDMDSMTAEMAISELHALDTAVSSLETGNAEDAKRVNLHARNLANFAKEHGVRIKSKASHSKLVAIKKTIDKLRGEHPEYALDDASSYVAKLL